VWATGRARRTAGATGRGAVGEFGSFEGWNPGREEEGAMSGALWVRDELVACGWQVEVADARKVKTVAPLAAKYPSRTRGMSTV
jgi:hypothetical protein